MARKRQGCFLFWFFFLLLVGCGVLECWCVKNVGGKFGRGGVLMGWVVC